MTPKEKAKELFDNYYIICQEYTEELQCSIQAKQCAINTVDEMILVLPFTDIPASLNVYSIHLKRYLDKVKHEIEQL